MLSTQEPVLGHGNAALHPGPPLGYRAAPGPESVRSSTAFTPKTLTSAKPHMKAWDPLQSTIYFGQTTGAKLEGSVGFTLFPGTGLVTKSSSGRGVATLSALWAPSEATRTVNLNVHAPHPHVKKRHSCLLKSPSQTSGQSNHPRECLNKHSRGC